MSLTDPVADFLARIRNAIRARHQKLDVPASKLKTEIARILKEEGYIANFKVAPAEGGHKTGADEGLKKVIRIYLKYATDNSPVVTGIERVSRPGCRTYVGKTDIPRVQGGLGISILTTPQGVMTGRTARKQGVGGEVLAVDQHHIEPAQRCVPSDPGAGGAA